jgi:hypothetical protein
MRWVTAATTDRVRNKASNNFNIFIFLLIETLILDSGIWVDQFEKILTQDNKNSYSQLVKVYK